MKLLIGFLTFILVVDCLLLMLLILIQLPKKEAGAGVAFGGAATDALFGAGSGNALTRMTKYTGTIFLVLAFSLSLLNSREAQSGRRLLQEELKKKMNALLPGNLPPGGTSNTASALVTPTQAVQSAAAVAMPNLTNAVTTNQSVALANTNLVITVPTQAMAGAKPAVTNQATTSSKITATNQTATSPPSAAPKP